MDVVKPDCTVQFQKTPAKVRIKEVMKDEQGQVFISFRWIEWMEGELIRHWHEWRDRVEDYINTATVEQLKDLFKKLAGDDYAGEETKRAILKALVRIYFPEMPDGTVSEIVAWVRERVKREGRWGLGCPLSCGRFWLFKPSEAEEGPPWGLTGFEPEDGAAMGYLNWAPQADGSVKFACDKCGGEVELS